MVFFWILDPSGFKFSWFWRRYCFLVDCWWFDGVSMLETRYGRQFRLWLIGFVFMGGKTDIWSSVLVLVSTAAS